ncbi:MAG: PTS sugar transporter subunit IIB [Calditerrivibrio sp.]|nr:PTS sugar transporter subunit IIB [Calditerrivibrio sp.]MCA1932466.1 PTS sugar transporter subunit IIB [Calditerrivibrio sp.]
MGKNRIFRIDDRLIHGQVIEGWIKYYKIGTVFIANDRVASDPIQNMIYKSIIPKGVDLYIYNLSEFSKSFSKRKWPEFLVLFESVADLISVSDSIDYDIDLNVGCVANRPHKYQISDTVFLDLSEIQSLCKLREKYAITVKKLPWETSIEIMNFNKLLNGDI